MNPQQVIYVSALLVCGVLAVLGMALFARALFRVGRQTQWDEPPMGTVTPQRDWYRDLR